jgi:Kdo2-lipid IVA lauroyltransferase/acyltransferase
MNPIRAKLEYLALAVFTWKMRWLPFKMARGVANFLGWIIGDLLKLRQEVALDNIKHAFPNLNREKRLRIHLRCWQHFLRVGIELARIPRMNDKFMNKWITNAYLKVMDDALKHGKGVIAVSGHLGNWEYTGSSLARLGYPVTYVVAVQSNQLVTDWMDRMRDSVGIEIVSKRNAIRGVLSALKRNRIVAIMCDQDAGDAGMFVPFFGKLASTPRGAAIFHLRTGAPVVFNVTPRDSSGVYHIYGEHLEFPNLSGDRDQDTETILLKINEKLENEIRKFPEQYMWLHRRWKTKPQ